VVPPTHDGLGEATSILAPQVNIARAEESNVMAEVEASSQQDLGEKIPEVVQEGLARSLARPMSAPALPLQLETTRPNV
jgi:hypothetical protein